MRIHFLHSWRGRSLFVIAAALLLVPTIAWGPPIRKRPVRPLLGGQVHGYVMAQLREGQKNGFSLVTLPDVRVFLRRLPSHAAVPQSRATTNAHGYFIIPRQLRGRYQICYGKAGFVPRCDTQFISIGKETVVLNRYLMLAPKSPGAVVGQARMKDGSIAFRETFAFGTLVTTQVTLLDAGGTKITGPITANSYGVFVVPGVTSAGNYKLTGTCALGTGSRSLTVGAGSLNGGTAYNLTLGNNAPTILALTALRSGTPVRVANVGDVLNVSVTAQDPDGDPLHYRWISDAPGFTSVDAPNISWHLQNGSATNAIFVEVTDGKGGFASRNLAVQAGISGILFSGRVVDRNTHAAIPGADVTLGAAHTTTNGVGAFQLVVPETDRYVLNVEKPQYALLSRVYYNTATNLLLELDHAQHSTVNGKDGGRAIFEGKGGLSTVLFPAGAFVDQGGNAYTGTVNAEVFAYDLQKSNPIPGDYSGIDSDGKSVRLETYGAIHVRVTDAGGQDLQVAPGKSAALSLAIDPIVQAAAPATIPLLVYEKKTGIWKQEGQFARVGNNYTAQVKHFSVFNADTVFNNTACIRMTVSDEPGAADPGGVPRFAPAFPFTLHIDYADAGGPRHNDFPVTDTINALLRLPPNINVTLSIVTAAGPSRTFTVNSGAAVPDAISFPPPFDYGACNGFDPNNQLTGNPVILAVDLPLHDVPYLGVPGTPNNPTEAIAYYKTIGALDGSGNPTAARGTFSAWKTTNGFSADPSTPAAGEIEGIYYNNGDLQLGRDMHCKCSTTPCTTTSDAACYVTNYGTSVFGGPQGQPDLAIHDAIHHAAPLATVAMEYRHADTNPVKFYIYSNTDTLLNLVALDSEGGKYLPHLCLACHGGSYDTNTHDAINANFLPFDVFSFLYDQVEGKTLTAQQESFRQLNAIIRGLRSNPADAIGGLVDGLYPCGVNNGGCAAVDSPFTPAGWNGNIPLYQTVDRTYCRGCHVAQPSLDWTQLSQWNPPSFIAGAVCNDPRFMPHGEVPFKKFWLSQNPHAPAFMFGPQGLNSGTCPP